MLNELEEYNAQAAQTTGTLEAIEDFDASDDLAVMQKQAIRNAPEATDDDQPRYAMSVFLPVPLYRQDGNNSYADFNPKNAQGVNIKNYNYYPPFALMSLMGGTFNIPYENQPTESEEPVESAPFDYNAFLRQPKNGYSSVYRSPKRCAEVFERECGTWGGRVLHALTGYHIFDNDRGAGAAREMFDLVFPVREIKKTVRTRDGVDFTGPFLDEILEKVIAEVPGRIRASNLPDADKQTAQKLYVEIRDYLQKAVQLANGTLNRSEEEIRSADGLKRTYDPPNLDVDDAPVSTDLYALAHTNRVEMDMKQLKASENIGRGLSDPMKTVADKLVEVVDRMQNVPAVVPQNVMTMEDVQKLLDKQAAEFDAKLKSLAVGQTAQAEAPTENTEPKSKKK